VVAPSLPLSLSPGSPPALASGLAGTVSSPELELLLELVPLAAVSRFGLAGSPGNGNFFAVSSFDAGARGGPVLEASGGSGTPPMLGGAAGVEDVPGSPGNGNFSAEFGFAEFAGFVPQGSGCGATVQGAGLAAGVD